MQLPQFLLGVPRIAYIIGAPVAIFLVTVVVTLATSGGGNGNDESPAVINPTVGPSLANIDTAPTRTPTAAPIPTNTPEPTPEPPPPNRADCDAIRGTDYESPEEREWFLGNCLGGGQTVSTNPGGGGGGGGGGTSPSGPAATGGGEYALGHRVRIPSIGVDASVNGVKVPTSGAMPDPVGYFNFVWYDFSNFGGLGGTASSGNYVLGCHVDSAVYGLALCYYVRNLTPGASIQVVDAAGVTHNYTVTHSAAYSKNTDFSGIVSGGAADLTIITCTGTFAGGSYDLRHVVQARRS